MPRSNDFVYTQTDTAKVLAEAVECLMDGGSVGDWDLEKLILDTKQDMMQTVLDQLPVSLRAELNKTEAWGNDLTTDLDACEAFLLDKLEMMQDTGAIDLHAWACELGRMGCRDLVATDYFQEGDNDEFTE